MHLIYVVTIKITAKINRLMSKHRLLLVSINQLVGAEMHGEAKDYL